MYNNYTLLQLFTKYQSTNAVPKNEFQINVHDAVWTFLIIFRETVRRWDNKRAYVTAGKIFNVTHLVRSASAVVNSPQRKGKDTRYTKVRRLRTRGQ